MEADEETEKAFQEDEDGQHQIALSFSLQWPLVLVRKVDRDSRDDIVVSDQEWLSYGIRRHFK